MVLLGRIELPTSALPRMRSTTELQQHTIRKRGTWGAGQGRALAARRSNVKRPYADCAGLSFPPARGKAERMETKPGTPSREERLAAKLRENLKRRKAQARASDARAADRADDGEDNGALPKGPARS